jgi:hypothetical protein
LNRRLYAIACKSLEFDGRLIELTDDAFLEDSRDTLVSCIRSSTLNFLANSTGQGGTHYVFSGP